MKISFEIPDILIDEYGSGRDPESDSLTNEQYFKVWLKATVLSELKSKREQKARENLIIDNADIDNLELTSLYKN